MFCLIHYIPLTLHPDFHLFRSLQNSINGLNFAFLELLKNYLDSFFAEKPQDFYEKGITQKMEKYCTK